LFCLKYCGDSAIITLYAGSVMEGNMQIGFAGAGAVGCHYGSKLIQSGFDVLLLARGEHLEALQRHGLRHESDGACQHLAVQATAEIERLHQCRIIVLSCKMTALKQMLASLQGLLHPEALILTLQNGVQAPDMTADAFPDHAIAAGTAFIGARIEAPGYVIHSAAGGLRLGLWRPGHGEQHLPWLMQACRSAAIPIRLDDDPAAMLWRKLLWNCGFNAITAITRHYARDMAAHAETLDIVRQAMQETVALAQAMGVAIGAEDIEKHIDITLKMGPVITSMWQDIEAGRRTEVDFINGYVATQAEMMQLSAATNRMLTTLMHAIEYT